MNMKKNLSLVALAAIILGASPELVEGQVYSPTVFPLTNLPPTLASNVVNFLTNSALQAQVIPLTKNCCLSVIGRAFTSAGAGNELVVGSFSADGTNFGVAPFTLTSSLGVNPPTNAIGLPTITVWTNWPQSYLAGFSAVIFNQVTNTGPGTVTNLAWVVNRSTLNTSTY